MPRIASRSELRAQREREAAERQWWVELKSLAASDDVVGFWRRYAQYLEWDNVVSESRQALHKMALSAVEVAKIAGY